MDPKRDEIYGNNKHEKHKPITYCELIWEGLHDFIIQVFIVATIISMVAGIATEGWEEGWIEGLSIFVAVLVIINVEAINDLQKDKQFAELSEINANKEVKVIRDGCEKIISTDDLVVGDVMLLNGGDTSPADGIFISGVNVKVDESKLTGESKQLLKNKDNPFIVSSSEIHDGSMSCLVVAVGQNSVFGKLKSLVESGNDEETPLQQKLEKLTKQLTVVGAVVAVVVTIILLLTHFIEFGIGNGTVDENGDPRWDKSNWNILMEYILTGISLLVIIIPEGLPLAVTIALAYSVKRMMKDNNLVRHLDACETMGGANTICSDKTGTLTQGKMAVVQAWILDGDGKYLNDRDKSDYTEFINKSKSIQDDIKELICENCALNNDGFLTKADNTDNEKGIGSSVDVALLFWLKEMGIDYKTIRTVYPKTTEETDNKSVIATIPFHSDRKRSSCVVKLSDNKYRLYVKGAPDMLVRLSDNMRSVQGDYKPLTGKFIENYEGQIEGDGSRKRLVKAIINKMGASGLRIIGLAYRDFDEEVNWGELVQYDAEEQKGVGDCPAIEDHLTLVGFLGLEDPVRPEVPDCVLKCQDAGIFVRMVTGDAMDTAKSIAKQCHIYHEDIRVDKYGKKYPPGVVMTGSQFRNLVGGLVLPPHFYHECHCQNYSTDPHFKLDYKGVLGFPSIVGHISDECKDWTSDAIEKRGNSCTNECKKYGCIKSIDKSKDKSKEIQKYKVVRNQAEFDPLVDSLQVLSRSAPTDKHLLVTGLMERGQVVAVTGDGTNDGPALAKSNVGFAMGISGTSVAQEASDIILMDDNFVSIVKAVKWGRNIYDSTRKFLQFQLAISGVVMVIGLVSALILRETPLKPVQMQWVHLIMDSLASLALATEIPTDELLDRPPYDKNDSIMSYTMLRNIISFFFYQVIILMFLIFAGHNMFGVPIGIGIGYSADPTVHITMVFNTFALLQVFNQINARKINNERNFFKNISKASTFIIILIIEFCIQILIVTFGGVVFNCKRLNIEEHCLCILMSVCCLINGELATFIPPKLFSFFEKHSYKLYGENIANLLTRSRLSSIPNVSDQSRHSKTRSSRTSHFSTRSSEVFKDHKSTIDSYISHKKL